MRSNSTVYLSGYLVFFRALECKFQLVINFKRTHAEYVAIAISRVLWSFDSILKIAINLCKVLSNISPTIYFANMQHNYRKILNGSEPSFCSQIGNKEHQSLSYGGGRFRNCPLWIHRSITVFKLHCKKDLVLWTLC